MATTAIEWATHVWNPFTGCDIVSAGCGRCYAKTEAGLLNAREKGRLRKAEAEGRPAPKVRYQKDGDPKTSGVGFGFTVHWDKLDDPERFPAGARVFVNSMSDVFHEDAPAKAIAKLFAVAAAQPWANFLILTKRPARMLDLLGAEGEDFTYWWRQFQPDTSFEWPLPNVWLGVSIESRAYVGRADLLRQTPAAVRFISAEPLLGPLVHTHCSEKEGSIDIFEDGDESPALDLARIDWLIVGGESGKGHRRIDAEWVRALRDETRCMVCSGSGDLVPVCSDASAFTEPCFSCDGTGAYAAFFFKQWGGRRAKEGGRELDGRTWDELPAGIAA